MNAPIDGSTVYPNPPYTANMGRTHGNDVYIFVVGFVCIVVLLTSLAYTSYICRLRSQSQQITVSFGTEDADNHHLITFSRGLDDDLLVTFPTFLYPDAALAQKGDTENNSSCSICLADYKPADVIRLIPECSHLFHAKCIDTWLKAH